MDFLTQLHSENVYLYLHNNISSKVTALVIFHTFKFETSLRPTKTLENFKSKKKKTDKKTKRKEKKRKGKKKEKEKGKRKKKKNKINK